MEDPLIHLDIRTSRSTEMGDVGDYFNRYEYDVYLLNDDDEEVLIGKGVAVLYLYGKMLNEGFDPVYAFDVNHHDDMYNILFDGGCLDGTVDVKEEWEETMAFSQSMNILVGDRLELLPEYRNKGYGKAARSLVRSFFDGCYWIEVIKSFPLQLEPSDKTDEWRAQLKYDLMEQDEKKATQSLNNCYKKDGYKRYKRTQIFYRLP